MRKVFIGLFTAAIAIMTPSFTFAEGVTNVADENISTEEVERVLESENTTEIEKEVDISAIKSEKETQTKENDSVDIVKVPFRFKSSVHVYALSDSFAPDNSYNRNWIKSVEYTDIGIRESIGEIELVSGFYQFSDEYRHNVLIKVENGKYYRWERNFSFIDSEIIEADPNYWDADYTPTMNIGFKNENGEIISGISFNLIYNGQEIPIIESKYMYYNDDDSVVITEQPVYNTYAYLSYGDYLLHINSVPEGYSIPVDRIITLSKNGIDGASEFGTVFIPLERVKESKKEIVKIAEPVKISEAKSVSSSKATVAAPTGDNTFLYGVIALVGLAGIVLGLWKTVSR